MSIGLGAVNSKPVSPTVVELRELRRGRGLGNPDVHMLAGARLREVSGILQTDLPAVVRDKLSIQLTELCRKLPKDLELAVLVGLGLHREASGQYLDQRMAWLAAQFDRDPRTARRRLDQAFAVLAQYIDVHINGVQDVPPHVATRWYTDQLKAIVRLDLPRPKVIEVRRIVATVDELDEITVAFSAPGTPGQDAGIAAEIAYGGMLVEREEVSASHCRFLVRLPTPLQVGNRHEYSIEFSARSRDQLRPYYALTPYGRCDYFSVHIRFGARVPQRMWQIKAMPARALDDFHPGQDVVEADLVGDVFREFTQLQQGLSYGVQWQDQPMGVSRAGS